MGEKRERAKKKKSSHNALVFSTGGLLLSAAQLQYTALYIKYDIATGDHGPLIIWTWQMNLEPEKKRSSFIWQSMY